jgi:hypothetical protein
MSRMTWMRGARIVRMCVPLVIAATALLAADAVPASWQRSDTAGDHHAKKHPKKHAKHKTHARGKHRPCARLHGKARVHCKHRLAAKRERAAQLKANLVALKRAAHTGRDQSAPTAPTNLSASGGTAQIALAWNGSTDNVGVTGYDVFQDGVKRASVSSAGYTATGLACGTSHSFTVQAYDAAGNHSAQSAKASASTSACPTDPVPPPAPSPSGSIYWGAWMGGNAFGSGYSDAPWDTNTWSRFESDASKPGSIVHFGNSWQSGGTFQSFPQGPLEQVRLRGAIPMLDWGTWNLGSSDQSAFKLSNIINGNFDSHIRNWATAAKNWGHPFMLRMDWEMNGNWFPWGEGTNGNSSGQYAQMWRHVHDIFTSVGATNVTWVWCPNTIWSGSTPLSGLYPGDAYVDWVGLDGYNWASVKGSPWQSFSSVIGPTYSQLSALAPSKPIAIGETGSVESGGSKGAWLTDMLNVLPSTFPKVKALVYFNKYAGDGAPWPIQSSSGARTAFAGGIGSSYYKPGGSLGGLPLLTKVPVP